MTTRVALTFRDSAALPADNRGDELHEGEPSVTPAPSPRHQQVSARLGFPLRAHVQAHGRGEVLHAPIDCILHESTVVQPHLVFLDVDRPVAQGDRTIEGPPMLVVEIVSPASARIDRGVKRQRHARHGVPHDWIVDPDAHRIEAYRLAGDTDRAGGNTRAVLGPLPAPAETFTRSPSPASAAIG